MFEDLKQICKTNLKLIEKKKIKIKVRFISQTKATSMTAHAIHDKGTTMCRNIKKKTKTKEKLYLSHNILVYQMLLKEIFANANWFVIQILPIQNLVWKYLQRKILASCLQILI